MKKNPPRAGARQINPWGEQSCLPGSWGSWSPLWPKVQTPVGQKQVTSRWFFQGWWLTGAGLSVLDPMGGGGGHEADAGAAAASAPTAAAEAPLGGQRAGGAGSASLTHEHRAASGACAQQVPAGLDDPGPAQAGTTGAAGPDATAAREGDSTVGEGGARDQGLRPAYYTAPGAAYGCGRERKLSATQAAHAWGPTSMLSAGSREGGDRMVAPGDVVPIAYPDNTHFSLLLPG